MKNIRSKYYILLLLAIIVHGISYAQTGTWKKVASLAPHYNMGIMLLLTDGTVLVHDSSGPGDGTGWDKLTPDAYGSYANGTWSTVASMHFDRLFFPSQVLPSGKVFVAGGENGSGDGDTTAEVYDPVANTWTVTGRVPGTQYGKPAGTPQNIYDGNSEILPDGKVLVGAQIGPKPSDDCLFFNPDSNSWSVAPTAPLNHDEAAWLKLPDSSILFVGIATKQSCRYRPQTNTWITDSTLPDDIYDKTGEESGSAMLLPNGNAIFFGASEYNAIYTPSGTAAKGTWTAGPDFPVISDTLVGQVDAPSAMMPNGHVLLVVSPEGYKVSEEFRNPVYFLEYDYITNTFTQVKSPFPDQVGDSIAGVSCNLTNFLLLPDGSVLLGIEKIATSNQYYIYTPAGEAIPQGKPTINSILPEGCPLYKITGKLFNGISEGTSYGDDWQNSTNWPLIRLTNSNGNVYYCKTTNWNRIGAVMTDSLEDTATFETPPNLPSGIYSLAVVVNGFASNPTIFSTLGETVAVISDPNIGSSTAGTASSTPSGGIPPYTYFWSGGGGTNATASGLSPGTFTITLTDNNACSDTAIVTITDNGVIYPNPNNGLFVIAGVSLGQVIEIYNYLGQKLSSATANNAVVKFDISKEPNGVYFIRITNENGTAWLVQRVVKIQ